MYVVFSLRIIFKLKKKKAQKKLKIAQKSTLYCIHLIVSREFSIYMLFVHSFWLCVLVNSSFYSNTLYENENQFPSMYWRRSKNA